MSNPRSLIRGRWVVVDAHEVLPDAAVLIDNGVVQQVGDWRKLRAAHPDIDVIGGEDVAVLPGLINAHHHSHAIPGILQGVSDDLLEPWILSWHAMRSVDRRLNTLISAGVQLGAGVVAVVDMMSCGGTADEFDATCREALDACDTAGLRVALAAGVSSRSHLVSGDGEDARFLASLPPDVRTHAESMLPAPGRCDETDYFAVMESLQADYSGHPRIDLWYGPPGPQWVSDDCLQRCAEAAARWDCGIQTHVNESYYEKLHGQRFYGVPTMLHLEKLGVLSPRFTIAHGTWLTQQEIDVMAHTGAAVSHNPSSNLRLRAGIAPFHPCLQQGVTTGIGMDATTLNEDDDMFAEMRLALRLQCRPQLEHEALTVGDVFDAATTGGARLLGKEQTLGKLAPGYAADVVVIDAKRLSWPWLANEADPLEVITLRAQRQDIRQVLIGGETVWRDGAPTRFDLTGAVDELAAQMTAAPFPAEQQRAVEAVLPHLRRWYQGWEQSELEPWGITGSRS